MLLILLMALTSCNTGERLTYQKIGSLQELVIKDNQIIQLLDNSIKMCNDNCLGRDSVCLIIFFNKSTSCGLCRITISAVSTSNHYSMSNLVTSRGYFLYRDFFVLVQLVYSDDVADLYKKSMVATGNNMDIEDILKDDKPWKEYGKSYSYLYLNGTYVQEQ